MQSVPLIDLRPWFLGDDEERSKVARTFGRACEEWGFVLVKGHGIDPLLCDSMKEITRAFFDLPIGEKLAVSAAAHGGRGYFRLASKSHARTRGVTDAVGDLRETYFSGMEPRPGDAYTNAPSARGHFAPNVWPESFPEMGRIWAEYMRACNHVASEMLRMSARALSLPDDWFSDKIDKPISTLTAQHYPALEKPPEPGQIRSGAHTDFGTLTLLMTEDRPGGLQVQSLGGEWKDIRPVPGAFIVNLGDMMSRWTNDRWRSTLHRVVNPPPTAGDAARRLSIVYFHTPNYDAVIECLPTCRENGGSALYPPILAGEHLAEKLRKTDSVSAVS